jgi:hypothetical protein
MSLNESPNLEQSALRLPTLSMTPSVDKLREALRLASNNARNIIELPWKSTNSPVNYMIKVTCQVNPQEPAWILHVGGDADDAILWNYNTADCQMIHGLITAEVDRAAYAAAGAQPATSPAPSPALQNPQIAPPQFSEFAAPPPPPPPPHLSQGVQQPANALQNQKSAYDWGSAQSASQQGQDWNWSSPAAAANANWSTSSHLPVNLAPESIVPINDPQAFSQSWGAPAPSISAPDSGLQRATKPLESKPSESKPPESSIFLSGPLAEGHYQGVRNTASQTLGVPQMSPVESLAPVPASTPAPAPVSPVPFAVTAPPHEVAPLSASLPLSSSLPSVQGAAALPPTPLEGPSLPIGGFAHSTPFSMSTMPSVVSPSTIAPDVPGVATLDSVPVLDAVAANDALTSQTVSSENVSEIASNQSDSGAKALLVVPSGRDHLTSTLSATLPLDVQETLTLGEDALTTPQTPEFSTMPLSEVSVSPPSPIVEIASVELAAKQSNKKKGRASKLNLPAIKAPPEAVDVVDQDTVAADLVPEPIPQATPEAVADLIPEPVSELIPVFDSSSAAPPSAVFANPPIAAPFNPVSIFEPEVAQVSPPVPPFVMTPLSIDLSAIPALPAIAEFASAAVAAVPPLSPPPPPPLQSLPLPNIVGESENTASSGAEQIPVRFLPEELDPTIPLNIATGSDIENSRLLHEPPAPVADLEVASEPASSTPVSEPVNVLPVIAEAPVTQKLTPVEQNVPAESAPKRALPPPAPFNRDAVDVIFKCLTNEETGFITNSAFMFFIVREFACFQKAQTPITLIGFELALRAPDGAMYPVHLAALRECGRRFFSVMRPLDWLAHYSDDEYALLLPHTNIREAILLVKDLYTVLNQGPLLPGMEDAQVVMHCGIASIPEDCQHPGILIAAAYEAMNEAKRSNLALQLFRDMPA